MLVLFVMAPLNETVALTKGANPDLRFTFLPTIRDIVPLKVDMDAIIECGMSLFNKASKVLMDANRFLPIVRLTVAENVLMLAFITMKRTLARKPFNTAENVEADALRIFLVVLVNVPDQADIEATKTI